ncbi:pickpocket protein 11-like [Anticarsia gemmatalis]|uniref:pickpocket protein 11-like n=1 Tax=Anticarsia gemmatalis TaxID=129554 RepID=UPI003F761086
MFRLLSDAEISIHSSEELSTNNLDVKMKRVLHTYSETHVDWLVSVVEIENDLMLHDEHVEERGCRFLNEIPDKLLHTYPVYSYGACRLAQSTEETFAHCGCIHPVRDLSYKKYYCNYTGMNCWNTFEEHKIKIGLELAPDECYPSCVESELSTIHFSKRWNPEESIENPKTILIKVKMVSLPALRYHRNLRRTHLDLVVSVGGIAGLFFSASILSLLELFYLILRPQKFDDIK